MWHWKYDYYLTLSDISIGLMGGWFYNSTILVARHFMGKGGGGGGTLNQKYFMKYIFEWNLKKFR